MGQVYLTNRLCTKEFQLPTQMPSRKQKRINGAPFGTDGGTGLMNYLLNVRSYGKVRRPSMIPFLPNN